MRELTKDDRLFYFERNFFTLDGLWIIEAEKATNFDTALKIDLAVWLKLLKTAYRRIKEHVEADTTTAAGILDVLAFRWSCEKWTFTIEKSERHEARAVVSKCPYKEIMDRNPERKALVPRICKEICVPIYDDAIATINPKARIERDSFMGLGQLACTFTIKA
ncbi:MAG: hypothetical protein GYA24_04800 [Candidatus Lokiarchaeota archaeon]|nr:hypothetical protein [Candidatus Lokiarchaeota archaeon]